MAKIGYPGGVTVREAYEPMAERLRGGAPTSLPGPVLETAPAMRPRLIQLALRGASHVLLIQGPPGSGKTVLLGQLADALKLRGHDVSLHIDVPAYPSERTRAAASRDTDSGARYVLVDVSASAQPESAELIALIRVALERGERVIVALRDQAVTTAIQAALPGFCSRMGGRELNFTRAELADFLRIEEHGSVAEELRRSTDGWAFAVRIVRDELAAAPEAEFPAVVPETATQRIFQYFDALLSLVLTSGQLQALATLRDLQVLAAEFLGAFAPDRHHERLLRDLSNRGLFVCEESVPEPRFRMHVVLRRYLQARFAGVRVDCDNAQQAAELLANRGHMRAALQFAAGANVPGLMTTILDRLGGLRVPLAIGLDAVPYFQIESIENSLQHPTVLLGRVYCALQQGRVGYAADLFRTFNERGLLVGGPRVELLTAVLLLILRLYESDRIEAGELDALQAKFSAELGDDDLAQAALYQLQASVFYGAGDTRRAYANARRVFEISAALDAPFFNQYAKFYLALTQLRLGNLSTAEALLKSAIAASEQEFGAHNPQTAQARILLARIYVERLQVDAAAVLLEENSDAADLHATWRDAVEAHITSIALVKLHRYGLEATLPELDERQRAFQGAGMPTCARNIQLLTAQLLLAYGSTAAARAALAVDRDASECRGTPSSTPEVGDLLGRLLALRARAESAEDILDGIELAEVTEATHQSSDVFMLLALRILVARCHVRQGRSLEAALAVKRVVETTSRFGLYASLGIEWHSLAEALVEDSMARLTAQELATLERVKTFGRPQQAESHDLAYPNLGRRERQVLEYLALGMSSKEMAQRLGISIGTVKGYRRSLFEKLGIFRRSEAVAIARTLAAGPADCARTLRP
jgi:ATP/maltotriose-dependent transcriptional regulator MalT